MDATKMTGKQILIQLGISVLASVIASYIMYKVFQPKSTTTTPTLPSQVSTTPPVTATTTPPVI